MDRRGHGHQPPSYYHNSSSHGSKLQHHGSGGGGGKHHHVTAMYHHTAPHSNKGQMRSNGPSLAMDGQQLHPPVVRRNYKLMVDPLISSNNGNAKVYR